MYRLVQDKIATIKEEPVEEQLGVNAPTRAGIRTGVGARAEAIQNALRLLMDYAQSSLSMTESCITRPTIQANNFELKPSYITMI